jgi:hypothetical protein
MKMPCACVRAARIANSKRWGDRNPLNPEMGFAAAAYFVPGTTLGNQRMASRKRYHGNDDEKDRRGARVGTVAPRGPSVCEPPCRDRTDRTLEAGVAGPPIATPPPIDFRLANQQRTSPSYPTARCRRVQITTNAEKRPEPATTQIPGIFSTMGGPCSSPGQSSDRPVSWRPTNLVVVSCARAACSGHLGASFGRSSAMLRCE